MSTIPSHLRYSAEHEWVDESSPVKVGLSAVAADSLGDVVYLDLPEAGSSITAGEVCGEVESTKSVSELFAPVTGTVVEVNAVVVDEPGLVNTDPYGDGWLFTVEVTEEGDLLTAEQYAQAQKEQA
ncbi:glycine cleavage system protein GcvH [Micrococcus sp. HSID17228]|uniref:glycine cleavage system protein GcvH n=1 Tax=Actinomycetes TaxID=1760 RepID=UPI000DFD7022|nr:MULTISPECIES: glycine cleavage system protein GcvH [Micrococcus]MCT1871433.1 glycine cleavage system protein GcvH [Micrococcus luteus]MCV7472577.1 glycine cleavage system protein GcvH [Micrococcus luteus]MCV7487844.1 glycine cleavage system protein GcvH [Micrococcus luteus]MCV7549077.1 glycine cleavage system protein GcvH [Micrococcus luteus]MCV7585531.1 glycine cleavage system protein GcvH [Micrococcus luteus]